MSQFLPQTIEFGKSVYGTEHPRLKDGTLADTLGNQARDLSSWMLSMTWPQVSFKLMGLRQGLKMNETLCVSSFSTPK